MDWFFHVLEGLLGPIAAFIAGIGGLIGMIFGL